MKPVCLLVFALATLLPASLRAWAAPDRVNPCTLLSQQDAASLFGAPLEAGSYAAPACAFHVAGGDPQKGVYLVMIGGDSLPAGTVPRMYTGMLQHEHGSTAEAFAGLGEQAHFIKVGAEGLRLQVLYHNRIVSLGAFASHNPDVRAALVTSMRQILQKL